MNNVSKFSKLISVDSKEFLSSWCKSSELVGFSFPKKSERKELLVAMRDSVGKLYYVVLPLKFTGYSPCFFGDLSHVLSVRCQFKYLRSYFLGVSVSDFFATN